MDWAWGNGPGGNGEDCLPLKKEMTANEFARFMANMLKADYVADDPYPADFMAARKKAFEEGTAANRARYVAAGMNPPVEHQDLDRVIVQFKNGSFAMKGLMTVSTNCTSNTSRQIENRPVIETHKCSAIVRYVHAPEAQFDAMAKMLENAGAAQNAAWTQAWIDENKRQTAQNIRAIQANGAAAIARSKASHEQFMQSQATRQKMHEDFLATMQRGTTMSMNRTQQI